MNLECGNSKGSVASVGGTGYGAITVLGQNADMRESKGAAVGSQNPLEVIGLATTGVLGCVVVLGCLVVLSGVVCCVVVLG